MIYMFFAGIATLAFLATIIIVICLLCYKDWKKALKFLLGIPLSFAIFAIGMCFYTPDIAESSKGIESSKPPKSSQSASVSASSKEESESSSVSSETSSSSNLNSSSESESETSQNSSSSVNEDPEIVLQEMEPTRQKLEATVQSCIPEKYKNKTGSNHVDTANRDLFQAFLTINVHDADLEQTKIIVKDIFQDILGKTTGYNFDLINFTVYSDGQSNCIINAYPKDNSYQLIMDGKSTTYTLDSDSSSESNESENDQPTYSYYGTFLEDHESEDGTYVVKFKIEPSWNNKTTVAQNFHTVEHLIVDGGGNKYKEIQYWAVADMQDGSEMKVISFTLDAETIQAIYNRSIVATEISDYADDLWILPSLRN